MIDEPTKDAAGNLNVQTNTIIRFDIDKDHTVDLSKVKMTAGLTSVVTSIFDVFLKRDAEMVKLMRAQAEQEGLYRAAAGQLNMVVGALTSEARVLRKERDDARKERDVTLAEIETLKAASSE